MRTFEGLRRAVGRRRSKHVQKIMLPPSDVVSPDLSVRSFLAQRSPHALQRVFGPSGPCLCQFMRHYTALVYLRLTLRHSGESVRPQVWQTCCSGPFTTRLAWIVCGEHRRMTGRCN